MKLEELCQWFSITQSMNHPEGFLKKCSECDGYNIRCYEYIPKEYVTKYKAIKVKSSLIKKDDIKER